MGIDHPWYIMGTAQKGMLLLKLETDEFMKIRDPKFGATVDGWLAWKLYAHENANPINI